MRWMMAVILGLAISFAMAWAQGNTAPATAQGPRVASAAQLGTDIMLLAQLNRLALSNQQLAALQAAYQAHPELLEGGGLDDDALTSLVELRDRLLRGEQLQARDFQVAMAAVREVMNRWRTKADNLLLDMLLTELTDFQRALLSAGWMGGGGGLQEGPGRGQQAEGLWRWLDLHRNDQPDEWLQERDRVADLLAQGAGQPGSTEHQLTYTSLGQFLERCHSMDEAELSQRRQELVAELAVLVPQRSLPLLMTVGMDEQHLRVRAAQLLLNPRTPELIQEILQVRGSGED